jgi:predicted nucleic acid-binding protein
MQSVLFDTSIYIAALRRRNDAAIALRRLAADAPVWLSSVVLQELYAGARGNHVTAVQRLERDFDRAKRILVPSLSDWSRAGRVLARLADQYDYELIGRGRLTNDALIGVSAGRMGTTVITANRRDFNRLAEFWSFQWRLAEI